jgi:uracil-DNA glycosylase
VVQQDRIQILDEVATLVHSCARCELCRGRTLAVPGHGDVNTDIMFIGEAPGMHEDRQGLPFVGASGQFLNELLASIQLDRSSVFITNIVKCRPPGNRDPLPDEIAACQPYLDTQIDTIDPLLIVTLGRRRRPDVSPSGSTASGLAQGNDRSGFSEAPPHCC